MRPSIDSIRKNFSEIEQEEYNSIDEIIIPFKLLLTETVHNEQVT